MIRVVLLIMPYVMLLFCNSKWIDDNVNIYKKKANKRLQPILYKLNGYKDVELGLIIYENFCYFNTILIVCESFLEYFLNINFERLLIFVFFCSLLFIGINNIISEIINK